MKNLLNSLDWKKSNDLIPAIIQHAETAQVLMLGYMNKEALEKTITDRQVTFFSRSKNCLWTKGETSGNFLELVDIQVDCDLDALLIRALPQGVTCHLGTKTCFSSPYSLQGALMKGKEPPSIPPTAHSLLPELYQSIQSRKSEMPEGSYTVSLLKEGTNKICAKIAEESGEVIKAATKETPERLTEESIDLIYHLFVLLVSRDITWNSIMTEIQKRVK